MRTSILPGLLKTARENRSLPLPMKIFEVSDVAVQDRREERQAKNYRRLGALYMDRKAGFEVAHGLLDRVMQVLGVPFLQSKASEGRYGYYIEGADGQYPFADKRTHLTDVDATYLPGRGARIMLRPRPSVTPSDPTPQTSTLGASAPTDALHTLAENLKSALPGSKPKGFGADDMVIGSLGILHPSVLGNFELTRPCSSLEIDVEPLL